MKRLALLLSALPLLGAAAPAMAHGPRVAGYAYPSYNVTPFVPTLRVYAPVYGGYAVPYDPCQPATLNFAPAPQAYQAAPPLQLPDPQPANVPNDPVPPAPVQPQPVYYQRVASQAVYATPVAVQRLADPGYRASRQTVGVYAGHYQAARFRARAVQRIGNPRLVRTPVGPSVAVAVNAGQAKVLVAAGGQRSAAFVKTTPRRTVVAVKAGPRRTVTRVRTRR